MLLKVRFSGRLKSTVMAVPLTLTGVPLPKTAER
jgi:hypothetical protein